MKLPNPEKIASDHSEKLKRRIHQEMIASGGLISFARFMELALYAPGLGYYSAGQPKLGEGGDFITAPEISPLFAKCVARQCQQILTELQTGDILEFGAGSGIFAKDLLIELEILGVLPETYFILEVSAELRERQRHLLEKHCPQLISRIKWLESLPISGINGIIFANEVIDAMPVHCFQIENEKVKERCVTWHENNFAWQSSAPLTAELISQIKLYQQTHYFLEGYQSEINLRLPGWINSISAILKKGIILLFDYGYGRAEYYHPDRHRGTLMCYYQHQRHADPLTLIGLQDISAHVDFTLVIENAIDSGCELAGYTTQAGFLLASGLLEFMQQEQSMSVKVQYTQAQAIKKLTLPSEMGESVKVMALSKDFDTPLIAFSLQDRRRDL